MQSKTTWQYIRRSPNQATAAIMILTLTFFAISFFSYIFYSSFVVLKYFQSRPQIIAFFKVEIEKDELSRLKTSLEETGKVSGIKYVSKKEALAIYRDLNKSDPLLLEMVTESILPDSLEISATDPQFLGDLSKILKKSPAVDKVSFPEDVINVVVSFTNIVKNVGITLIIFLLINSLLVISTIISMKISLRKNEIEILRLLGADKGYIQEPFILEGAFYGLVASLLGAGVCSLIVILYTPFLVPILSGIPLLPFSFYIYLSVIGGCLVSGLLIGIISSLIAVSRYQKA